MNRCGKNKINLDEHNIQLVGANIHKLLRVYLPAPCAYQTLGIS